MQNRSFPSGKSKVLVVEDERIILKDLTNSLYALGYDVVGAAKDSIEAINKVKELSPDIVIMDIYIEGPIDGIETAKIIHTSYDVPVVFLTAYSDYDTIERAKQVLPYAYLLKPFGESELLATIELSLYKFKEEKKLRDENRLVYEFIERNNVNSDLSLAESLEILSGKLMLFHNTLNALFVIDQDGKIIESNEPAQLLIKQTGLNGKDFASMVQLNQASVEELVAECNSKSKWEGYCRLQGEETAELMKIHAGRLGDPVRSHLLYISIYSDQIVQNRKDEQLEDLYQRLSVLTHHLTNVVIYESGSGRDYVSDNVCKLLGYSLEHFKSHDFFWTLIHPDDYERIHEASFKWYYTDTADSWTETYRLKKEDGTYIWVRDQMYQVRNHFDKKYKIGLLIDIDELVQKEQLLLDQEKKLKASLAYKDVLIQEIHHRVRNNLQIISSLLNLQSTFVEDTYAQRLIHDSQNRVRTLSMVYENLYKTDEVNKINLREYLQNLANSLYHNYRVDISAYKMHFDMDDVWVSVDMATPFGLIVNELISNVFKHAFSGKEEGNVSVSLKKNADRMVLHIADDGIGLPQDFKIDSEETLGVMLVASLADQIKAGINYTGTNGASFEIVVPLNMN